MSEFHPSYVFQMEKQETEVLQIAIFLSNLCTCTHGADVFLNNHSFILSMFQSRPSDYSNPKERQICCCVTVFYISQSRRERTVYMFHKIFLYIWGTFFFCFLLQSKAVSELVCEILDLHLDIFTVAFSSSQFITFRLSIVMRTPLKSSYAYTRWASVKLCWSIDE